MQDQYPIILSRVLIIRHTVLYLNVKNFPCALSLLARHSRATAAAPFEDPDVFHGGAISKLPPTFKIGIIVINPNQLWSY